MTRHKSTHNHKSTEARKAKAALVEAGISQLRAAPQLGVTFEHLNRVLNGHRKSRRLIAAVMDLAQEEARHG